MSSIYFMGIYFNQDLKNKPFNNEFINEYIDLSEKEEFIKIFPVSEAVFFKTEPMASPLYYRLYEQLKIKDTTQVDDPLYLYHFFDTSLYSGDSTLGFLDMYCLISNIENITRLIISIFYVLAPDIPFPKKDNKILKTLITIRNEDIDKLLDFIKIPFTSKKKPIYIDEIYKTTDIQEFEKEIVTFIKKHADQYNNIASFISNLETIWNSDSTKTIKKIRGKVAHNTFLPYNPHGDLTPLDKNFAGISNIEEKLCFSMLKDLEHLLESITTKYSNYCEHCKEFIQISSKITCKDCKVYIGHIKTKKIKCLEFEYVKCSNCEHLICEECLEESKSFLDSSIWYCSGCNELYCQDCVTECENCGDAFFCEECKDENMQSCDSCYSELCLACAEEIKDCKWCDTTQICPVCSDDGDYCNHCDEKLNKDD